MQSHNISIQIGNIFKHMSLPKFEPGNKDHIKLSDLVRRAHSVANGAKRSALIEEISALGNGLLNL